MQDRDKLPYTLTLEQVTQTAKAVALRDGVHHPTVLAEGHIQTVVAQMADFAETANGRSVQLFQVGLQLALSGEVGVLQQVFFISEAWMSTLPQGKQPQHLPSEDPQRQEMLMIAQLRMVPRSAALVLLHMIRDEAEKLIALEAMKSEHDQPMSVESPLLTAFIVGFTFDGRGKLDTQKP